MENGTDTRERVWLLVSNSHDSANPFLGINPKELKVGVQTNACMEMFIAFSGTGGREGQGVPVE